MDRTFRDGERFQWEEFEFEITHWRGHTEFQMALYVTLDGKRVAFTGDAFFETGGKEGALRHNLVFRNQVHSDSHLKSIRSLIDHEPDVIAPGHGRQQMFADILPVGETDFGMDPSWVSIYPYQNQILLSAGERQRIEIRVRYYRPEPMKIEAALAARWTPSVPRFAIACNVMRTGGISGRLPRRVDVKSALGSY